MKRRLVPVLGSSLLLWAVTASAALIAPDDDPSLSLALAPVRLDVWDDSFKNLTVWNPPRRAPTWRIVATREELERMNLRVHAKRGLWLGGPGSTCSVESLKTGEELNFDEAWLVFGDILSKQQAAAADREETRRRAIRERLGIARENADRLSQTH